MIKPNSQILIILVATVLMQIHSISFWIEQIGPMGAAWSLTLEIVMLWFWWRRIFMLALIASALLITGPLHQITQPSINAIKEHRQTQQLNQTDRLEINRLQASLTAYEKNSLARTGWLSKINRIQKRINIRTDRISERNANNSEFRFFGISIKEAIAAAQALTLIIIMIAQAIAISDQRKTIAKDNNAKQYNDLSPEKIENQNRAKSKNSEAEPIEKLTEKSPTWPKYRIELIEKIDQIPQAIHAATKAVGVSQGQWCDQNNINPKHLSLAKNHAQRLSRGLEVAPAQAIRQIMICLNIIDQSMEPQNGKA